MLFEGKHKTLKTEIPKKQFCSAELLAFGLLVTDWKMVCHCYLNDSREAWLSIYADDFSRFLLWSTMSIRETKNIPMLKVHPTAMMIEHFANGTAVTRLFQIPKAAEAKRKFKAQDRQIRNLLLLYSISFPRTSLRVLMSFSILVSRTSASFRADSPCRLFGSKKNSQISLAILSTMMPSA